MTRSRRIFIPISSIRGDAEFEAERRHEEMLDALKDQRDALDEQREAMEDQAQELRDLKNEVEWENFMRSQRRR